MSTNPLEELSVTKRTVKRAQYEAFEFSLAPDGVQVRNTSHANPGDHEYLVEIDDGVPTACTCPADETYSGACKHRIAVAIRRPIIDAATQQQLVADGGTVQSNLEDQRHTADDSSDERDCDCTDLSGEFPCWECYRSGRRELPDRL